MKFNLGVQVRFGKRAGSKSRSGSRSEIKTQPDPKKSFRIHNSCMEQNICSSLLDRKYSLFFKTIFFKNNKYFQNFFYILIFVMRWNKFNRGGLDEGSAPSPPRNDTYPHLPISALFIKTFIQKQKGPGSRALKQVGPGPGPKCTEFANCVTQ